MFMSDIQFFKDEFQTCLGSNETAPITAWVPVFQHDHGRRPDIVSGHLYQGNIIRLITSLYLLPGWIQI